MDWWLRCRQSLFGEPVNVLMARGIEGDYPAARCRAFALGDSPFVSYVDPDDYVTRGAFARCLAAFTPQTAAVWTKSLTLQGDAPEWRAKPYRAGRPHQLIVARREAVQCAIGGGRVSDAEIWRRVERVGVVKQIPYVGYVWRQHSLSDCGLLARSEAAR